MTRPANEGYMGKVGESVKKKIANGFMFWAAGYALLTVISSAAQLFVGTATDTNLNILARALICLIPIVTYYLFGFGKEQKWTRALLLGLIHYVISLGCALLLIYLAGMIAKSAPTSYLNILISFTAVYLAVAAAIAIHQRRLRIAEATPK